MKSLNVYLIAIVVSVLFTSFSYAQPRDENSYVITKGQVSVTPAICPGKCEVNVSELSGEFVAFLPGGGTQLFFPASDLVTRPNINFELPEDPNTDSDGASREVVFTLDNGSLSVQGSVDSGAFDGPLVEYTFSAVLEQQSFKPKHFYTARPDFRRCVSPLCGGYFVKRVNSRFTHCANGSRQRECYVAELQLPAGIELPALGFRNKAPLLLQGRIKAKVFDTFGNLGSFDAKAVYAAATNETPSGRFFGIENNGLVCVTSPCFSYDAYVLNKRRVKTVSSINLDNVSASPEQIDQAYTLLSDGEVLLASGHIRKVKTPYAVGREFDASGIYLPVASALSACASGYQFVDGACRTPFGCEFPQLELTGTGGAVMIDPITGEQKPNITKSCIDSCEPPAFLDSPGQCSIFFP